mmetsp:Transcript_19418/g.44232  ORF Transcript_19418/g.44232 Transcript_19418/m.44232 type:complete len:358 (-) Transcript_19418:459-1532(-)
MLLNVFDRSSAIRAFFRFCSSARRSETAAREAALSRRRPEDPPTASPAAFPAGCVPPVMAGPGRYMPFPASMSSPLAIFAASCSMPFVFVFVSFSSCISFASLADTCATSGPMPERPIARATAATPSAGTMIPRINFRSLATTAGSLCVGGVGSGEATATALSSSGAAVSSLNGGGAAAVFSDSSFSGGSTTGVAIVPTLSVSYASVSSRSSIQLSFSVRGVPEPEDDWDEFSSIEREGDVSSSSSSSEDFSAFPVGSVEESSKPSSSATSVSPPPTAVLSPKSDTGASNISMSATSPRTVPVGVASSCISFPSSPSSPQPTRTSSANSSSVDARSSSATISDPKSVPPRTVVAKKR